MHSPSVFLLRKNPAPSQREPNRQTIIYLGIFRVDIIVLEGYNLLKENVEAAMFDAVDLAEYRANGSVTIDEEKFVENFIRRFAESAELSNTYVIEIYDINTAPPKVSLRVSSKSGDLNLSGDPYADEKIMNFDIVNNIDAILETKY